MNPESGAPTPAQPAAASAAVPDLRPPLSRALGQAEDVIASVTPDQMTRPTPCTEWDVRELLIHLVKAARRIAAVGEGRPAVSVEREAIPDRELRDAFHTARQVADRAWADDAALTREVEVPWGRMPGALVLGMYLAEVVTHTWDLWSAIDSTIALDPELAEMSLTAAHRALPASRDNFPFGAVVEVSETAGAYSRLAGWMGRSPAWRGTQPSG